MHIYYNSIVFVLVLISIVFLTDLAARIYNRKTGESSSYFFEVQRKLLHAAGGLMFAFSPYFGIVLVEQYLVLVIALFILTINEQKLFLFKNMRPGAVKYTWAFCLVTILPFYYHYYVIFTVACAIYAIPDSFAALVGRAIGKPVKVLGGKSIAGFLAYTISTFCILYLANISIPICIGLSLVLAVIELVSKSGSDNFFCPVLGGVALYLLGIR